VGPQCEVARKLEARCRRHRVDDLAASTPQTNGHRRTRLEHSDELASASSMRSSGTCWNVLIDQPAENVESANALPLRGIAQTTHRCRGGVRRGLVGAGGRPRLRSTSEVAARCRPCGHASTPAVFRWQQFTLPPIQLSSRSRSRPRPRPRPLISCSVPTSISLPTPIGPAEAMAWNRRSISPLGVRMKRSSASQLRRDCSSESIVVCAPNSSRGGRLCRSTAVPSALPRACRRSSCRSPASRTRRRPTHRRGW